MCIFGTFRFFKFIVWYATSHSLVQKKYMFSREKSRSVRVPVDLQPRGRLHNMWVYLYPVSSSTGASAIEGFLQEAESHSRRQCILSAVRRRQILCAFLSHLLKPMFDVAIVPPGDEI